MKAVIIAGGFGTRLRPLSCTRPKHLFPIGGKPLLDWTLERLADAGVTEIVFAVNYMSGAFVRQYGKSAYGTKTHYCRESKPLGTGGCVKNAERIIGHNESFLLLNGDILSKIDYADLLAQHTRNGGIATIALHRVDDPSRYGVVELADKNRVKRFVEKPPHGKAPSNLINAGVYALSTKILDYIPSKRRVSIEREVFPALARDNELFGYEFSGPWIDIGEPADFLKGNRLLLDSELKKGSIAKTARVASTAIINNPVAIGERTKIGARSTVGPHVTLGEGVAIGKSVLVKNSVIFPRTVVSDFSRIKDAIIGEGVSVGKRVKIVEGCLIGDHVTIHDGVKIAKGVTLCPHKEVTEDTRISKCLM
ncbi:MAG TPA: NDP-sugar synthase [Candidatus Bathyarchaeia archaeon]|nr:NDP-sugar synthase [Candidatus Bathyarchaeia archaeon]